MESFQKREKKKKFYQITTKKLFKKAMNQKNYH